MSRRRLHNLVGVATVALNLIGAGAIVALVVTIIVNLRMGVWGR